MAFLSYLHLECIKPAKLPLAMLQFRGTLKITFMPKLLRIVPWLLLLGVACKKEDIMVVPPVQPPPVIAVDFNIVSNSVVLDPYGFAPLSALATFTAPVSGRPVIIVKGKNGRATDIIHVFADSGLTHALPVIGLYADYLNTVLVRIISPAGDTLARANISIQTAGLPPYMPTSIIADIYPNDHQEPGINLVSNFSAGEPHIPLMVDTYGDIRWLLNYSSNSLLKKLNYQDGIKRLRNGNFYFGDFISDQIYEVDLLGRVIHMWDLNPLGYVFHHDIDEEPNGNFIISVSKNDSKHLDGSPTDEDYIIELDRQNGSILTVWDLKELLDENRHALLEDPYDWIHINSVLFDSTDHTIIVSGRVQGVAKLTFDNHVKWIMAPHRGWGTNRRGEDLNQFLLTPLAPDGSIISDTAVINGSANHPGFEWCWYQHSVIALPNGDLMLFDNGDYRNFNPTGPKYSRAVEFAVDPVHMTIQQKWQYGKERGLETFSPIVSSVQYLPQTGHVLFCPGYQVQNYTGIGGKIVEVNYTTRQVVSQISMSSAIGWGFHRAKRVSAYPE